MSILQLRLAGVAAFCSVLVCSPSLAQIDHRVNQGNAASGARALDRNPNIGSGGYNLTRPGFDSGVRSDAIITGNVTGLGGFHGYSPIPQSNAFRDQLPSTSLSGFQSRGVGLKDVATNQVPGANYFYDSTRTIADTGQIQRGQNMPGSSQLRSTNLTPQISSTPLVNQPMPNVRDPADTRLGVGAPPTKFGLTQTQIGNRVQPKPVDSIAPTYRAASESSIFGTMMPRVSPPLTDQRSDVAQPALAASVGERAPTDQAGVKPSTGDTPRPTIENRPLNEPSSARSKPPEEPSLGPQQSSFGSQTPSLAERLPMDGRAPANLGADRFADLYSAVRAAEQIGLRDLALKPAADGRAPARPGLAQSANDDSAVQPGHLARQTGESVKQLATAAKWASDVLEAPVTSFVGKNQDRLNKYMADGEAALKARQYYRAADQFDMAHLIDPLNPLPLLNRGHALVAAGDYISALGAITKGLERFPHIAAFRLDLPKMVGNSEIYDVRRADLEKQLAARDSYELRFLLGYLEFYSGLPDVGIENLKRAQKAAPPESTIAEFVRLLTGEKAMPDLPTE